jgi:membrane protein DedA with SNARE-associated domain
VSWHEHFFSLLGSPSPAVQIAVIIAGTFLLEDLTTALVALAVSEGMLPTEIALAGLYTGVALGDFGLYWLGRLATRYERLRRVVNVQQRVAAGDWLKRHTLAAVFWSRFVPGLRLPTYTAFGFLRVPFERFAPPVVAATLLWTSLLFAVALLFGQLVFDRLGEWRWYGAIAAAIVLALMMRLGHRHMPSGASRRMHLGPPT